MAKEGINGVFGKPKSLRSKMGKTSDRLEEDAQAMEARLLQLRVTMMEEKQKRDAELPLKHAGNRWRSAREDRGSVRQYAKDVQLKKYSKKQSKKEVESGNGAASSGSKPKKSSSRTKVAILSPATVQWWTVPQVLEWLAVIGLDEFQSGFEFHQVTGQTLLDLTPDGYEKLGVFKLSARNRLLAEMEQIHAQQPKKRSGSSAEAAEIIDPKLRDTQLVPEMPSPPSKLAAKTHWSHIAPLSDNAVAVGDGCEPVNLADGEFDEEAGHASFMKALLEWRESDSNQPAAMSNQEEEWVNPVFNDSTADNQRGGGALFEGTYDEQEAHNSFQEALLAWRIGGDAKHSGESAANCSAPPVEQTETGCEPGERKSCWQCYRVVQVDALVHDDQTSKSFCGSACQEAYREQYARFYTSPS
ncbi:hypothetical protein PF005_g17752 [Phytophthora fragariae]|uniref:SAM domain-containing protein n=1 Tax=Phytophthora fragariae TaxID=53985 RepID=A0A6A3T4W6_9STRA|nr:hypothetical protein PF003_g40252 [Phytophthora fragariae]KAE8930894.1 hypothetical protein PF009_g19033 [Phytophthora fragariae]KAE8988667.1 hypothetical protein PF011_g19078 [Phytophthora fragariae]KAE9094024.1 hypothetical protein PF007_g17912 [Phytophthora fragariae]KAE9094141.1 hypothetical protein PF010_g17223 [Phytophthora fragariae]